MVGKLKVSFSWPRLAKASLVAGLAALTYWLYFWHLGRLVPGLSAAEIQTRAASHSLRAIFDSPLNGPYYAWERLWQAVGHGHASYLRLGGSLIALGLVYCFFSLCRRWLGAFMAALASLAFASLPWLVLSARTASADIMWLSPLVLAYLYNLVITAKNRIGLKLGLLALAAAVVLYTPGLIWFALLGAIFAAKPLWQKFRQLGWAAQSLISLIFLATLAPLARGLVIHHVDLRSWLLIPHPWFSPLVSLKGIAWALLMLIWRAPTHLPIILGRLPILSAGLIVLMGLGLVNLYRHYSRWLVVAGLSWTGLVTILAGINQAWPLVGSLAPFCLLAGAFGLDYLYKEWRSIFPRNPLAKATALVLIFMLIGAQLTYALRYSLVAWPHSPLTRAAYVLK